VTLTDTNILLRSLYPEHPHYSLAEKALVKLRLRQETLCLAPQNLIEFGPSPHDHAKKTV
jgi:predicted nucleic acid-binding protein